LGGDHDGDWILNGNATTGGKVKVTL
jgi:hypothetical protein